MDPRQNIIEKRLANINRLIAVASGKGGVGKSLIATTLALSLSKKGRKVGLLDLDFQGPSAHVILGLKNAYPKEEKGIVPPEVHGIRFMSIVYYVKDEPSPLRGTDVSNAIIELLAITQWKKLDFLVVDMPPGIGDQTLDLIRFMKGSEFLVTTTPSKVALETVKKLLKLLKELKIPIMGLIENMKMFPSSLAREQAKELSVPFLGEISFDRYLEEAIGNPNKLLETKFARDLNVILSKTNLL
ncbi:MAG TPA: Mrp/NBP35 family ATP-binding protein [Thermoplasmata archaeon]|nr:Mrp/NBP35 family ATP-binding protein [Thermoplasmata archaeon]